MRLWRLSVAAFLIGWTSAIPAAAAEPTKDEASIIRILDDEGSAWLRGDAVAFAANVSPDLIFVNTVGMFSIGKEAFTDQHRLIFATIYKGSEMRQFVQKITFIGRGAAIVDTVTKLSGIQQLPTGAQAVDGSLYTRLEQIMVKDGAKWTVSSFHNVPIQPKFVDESVRSLVASQGH